jgi:hypothetical protein
MLCFSTMSWPVIAPVLVFLVLYLVILKRTPPGVYALDPQDAGTGANRGRGTFEPHNKNYLELSKLIIGLGSASIGAVAVFFFRNDSSAQGLQGHIAWPLIFFVASVVYGVAFIGMLVWRYELYCHRSETYTRPWYALILSLGFSMLICLAGGYAIFVWILLHA